MQNNTVVVVITLLSLVSLVLCATTTVTCNGLTFSPSSVTINIGDTVTWTNLGIHNVAQVSSSSATSRQSGGFYSGAIGSQPTYSLTFSSAMVGNITSSTTFNYICEAHIAEGMRGSVTVSASTSPTTPSPSTSSSPSPPAPYWGSASRITPVLAPLLALVLLLVF
jgi:plastocyanin